MKLPKVLQGWPYRTWGQGYVLGVINGMIVGTLWTGVYLVLAALSRMEGK